MADTDDKRGPLSDQLVQARLDAANRKAVEAVALTAAEPALDVPAASATQSAQPPRRPQKWLCEVRLGIEVLTNLQHQPPPPAPPDWEEPRRQLGRLYRGGLGRRA